MRIFIDCEFNGFCGELISLALVDEAGREFYSVLRCNDPEPWVEENVIPVLNVRHESLRELQARLERWLSKYREIHVIADWPEDIAHFCKALISGPGMRLATPPLTMEVRRDLSSEHSLTPHNALEDAKAIRLQFLQIPGPDGLQP